MKPTPSARRLLVCTAHLSWTGMRALSCSRRVAKRCSAAARSSCRADCTWAANSCSLGPAGIHQQRCTQQSLGLPVPAHWALQALTSNGAHSSHQPLGGCLPPWLPLPAHNSLHWCPDWGPAVRRQNRSDVEASGSSTQKEALLRSIVKLRECISLRAGSGSRAQLAKLGQKSAAARRWARLVLKRPITHDHRRSWAQDRWLGSRLPVAWLGPI